MLIALLGASILEWLKIRDNHMLSARKLDTRHLLSRGVLVSTILDVSDSSSWTLCDAAKMKSTAVYQMIQELILESNRSCCCSYPPCLWFRYSSCWSSRVWKHVSLRSHVRSHQSMAQVASEDQPRPEVRFATPRPLCHEHTFPHLGTS